MLSDLGDFPEILPRTLIPHDMFRKELGLGVGNSCKLPVETKRESINPEAQARTCANQVPSAQRIQAGANLLEIRYAP